MSVLSLLPWLLPGVHASTFTEIPPFLKADAGLGYQFDRLAGVLAERALDPGEDPSSAEFSSFEVAKRRVDEHRMTYRATFGVGPGLALGLELPHSLTESVSYLSAQTMVYNPASGTGTLIGTAAGNAGVYETGAGIDGAWFTLAGVPFSESYTKRNNLASWKLGLGVRTPDKSSFWAVDETGRRGAGPGAFAWRIDSAFSKRLGNLEPYLDTTATFEGKQTVTSRNNAGEELGDGPITVRPADHLELRIGTEVLASSNPTSGSRLVLDVHGAANYGSYAEIPSGLFLPDVLSASDGGLVQQSEFFELGGGAALRWRPMEFVEVGLWGDLLHHLPQRIESTYPVYTWGSTLRSNVGVDFTIRLRPAPDAGQAPVGTPADTAPAPTSPAPWGSPS